MTTNASSFFFQHKNIIFDIARCVWGGIQLAKILMVPLAKSPFHFKSNSFDQVCSIKITKKGYTSFLPRKKKQDKKS